MQASQFPVRRSCCAAACALLSALHLACQVGEVLGTPGENALESHSTEASEDTVSELGSESESGLVSPSGESSDSHESSTDHGTTADDGSSDAGEEDEDDGADDGLRCHPGQFPELCAEGYKCTPAKVRPSDTAALTSACIPITGDRGIDEPCTRDADAPSDDCAQRLWCSTRNSGTSGPGFCQPLCDVNRAADACQDDFGLDIQYYCLELNDGYLPICVMLCDPLFQDCPKENDACYAPEGEIEFYCQPRFHGERGRAGDECKVSNECLPGLGCVSGERLLACEHERCCSYHCELREEPNICDKGESCIAWAPQPIGLDEIGFCGVE